MATVKLDPAKGIQIPNLTTTERNAISSPETGAIIWNTTTSEINQYNGSAWEITYTDTNTQIAGITSSADATAITIDSSENVGIGVTPAMASSSYNGLHIGATYPTMKLSSNSSGHAAADGFHLRIDSTPRVEYWNYENTDQVFSNNNSEKIRILAGGGITFNGDTAAANALDDYEEGTWTPTLSGTSGGPSGVNFTSRLGWYTKIGRVVIADCRLAMSSWSSGPSGSALISGLPFNPPASSNYFASPTIGYTHNFDADNAPKGGFVEEGSSVIRLIKANDSDARQVFSQNVSASALNGNETIFISVAYIVSA